MRELVLLAVVGLGACASGACPEPALPTKAVARVSLRLHRFELESSTLELELEKRNQVSLQLWKRCEHGNEESCFEYAREFPELAFEPRITATLQRRCRAGAMAACRLLEPGDRPDLVVTSCTTKACVDRLAATCNQGSPDACRELGHRTQDLGLLRRANQLAEAGCAAGIDHECALLANPSVSVAERIRAWSRACERGSRRCFDVAQLLLVNGDPIGARDHLELACRLFGSCDALTDAYRARRIPEFHAGRLAELEARTCRSHGTCSPVIGGQP